MIRIFARYLLANHWEVLQLTQAEKYRYNEKHYSNAHYTIIESIYYKTVNLLLMKELIRKSQIGLKKKNNFITILLVNTKM